MANLISFFKKSTHFISNNLWTVRLDKVNKSQGILIKQLRIFALASKGFNEDKCLTKASALTFYTLFSIVPILALIFAIAKGFGFDKTLQKNLLENYGSYSSLLQQAFVYADSLLSTTKGGVIAGFGVVLLLWSVMKLLVSIEASFNEIWEIRRGRTWLRKVTDYLTIMMVSPLFLIISGSLTVAIQTKVGNLEMMGFLTTFLLKVVAYAIVAGVFTFVFMVLPNTKVNFKSAFIAAIFSTIFFELLGWGYVKFQVGANHLSAIYGGFAALPLFLIWIQYSWYIVLFGAELAFANQNVGHYELDTEIKNLSARYKKVIALMIANLVAKRFYNGEKAPNINEIAQKLDLPIRLARNVVNDFVATEVFVEVKTENDKEVVYQPGVTESKFNVKFVFNALEKKGVNEIPIEDTHELKNINHLMKELDKTMDSHLGTLMIKDIVK